MLGLADFASIGTNDLIQFMLAADRNALDINEDHSVLHPAVLRGIKLVADAAAEPESRSAFAGRPRRSQR